MDEQQIRRIVKEEVSELFKLDRYSFSKPVQLNDGINIQVGRTTGTKIGTKGYVSITDQGQKLGFFGQTPIIQRVHLVDPSGGGDAGVDQPARTAINSLIDTLKAFGLMRADP